MVLAFSSCAGTRTLSTAAPSAIAIDASKDLKAINPEIFGQNIAVWEGTADGNDEAYNAAVRAIQPSVIRFPGGGYADLVNWENIPQGKLSWVPINMDKGIAFAKACNSTLQIIVNFAGYWDDADHGHEAAVKKAADWVKYMNVANGGKHYVKYWEVGNEQFVSGEKGFWSDDEEGGDKYGAEFVDFYKAMKKADPKIMIGAQCQFDHADFTRGVLKALKKKGCVPDFFITHVYPIWMAERDAAKAPSWDKTLYGASPVLDARIMDNAYVAVSATAVQDSLVSQFLGKKYAGTVSGDYTYDYYSRSAILNAGTGGLVAINTSGEEYMVSNSSTEDSNKCLSSAVFDARLELNRIFAVKRNLFLHIYGELNNLTDKFDALVSYDPDKLFSQNILSTTLVYNIMNGVNFLGYWGMERWASRSAKPAGLDYLENVSGIGADWDVAPRTGLFFRIKNFFHKDMQFDANNFHGWQFYLELKSFF